MAWGLKISNRPKKVKEGQKRSKIDKKKDEFLHINPRVSKVKNSIMVIFFPVPPQNV